MINEPTKHVVDGLSVSVVLGTIVSVLPAIAAFFSIVWTVIRIYETKTCQKCIAHFRSKKKEE